MALAPKFIGQKFAAGISPTTTHTLDIYLDYVCPFSRKMFNSLYTHVLPTVETRYRGKLAIIFRQQIQPWHPSSTLTHEAGAAVLKLAPNKFYEFSYKLFEKQTEFFDVSVVNETRNQTYKRLAEIAGSVGVDEGEVFRLLEIQDTPGEDGSLNSGNGITDDLKVLVKVNRLVGIHVTPTVIFNGAVENAISSSFTKEQWEEWLEKNIT
ncbi:hypothetical protein M501DRAFT_996776 [Patellaria atrata CBS 101060]|uniref:Thioredoxin-like fold domain-containing protein n=1 Tax=Patellaria atrata CBS 101060 TaxID=1346257 RepID=A0A9P4S5W2_9PEZI|nr:hypothetical protein M501DRAFT_996776 [Patellaria atrata CBS 101060]